MSSQAVSPETFSTVYKINSFLRKQNWLTFQHSYCHKASFETRMTNFELEVLNVSIVVDISYIQCYQLNV